MEFTSNQATILGQEKEKEKEKVQTQNIIKRHPLIAFFGLAYLLTWTLVGSKIAGIKLPGALPLLGPSLSALLVIGFTSGKAGYKNLVARLFRWKVSPRWYAMTLLFTPLIGLLALAFYRGLNLGEIPVWQGLETAPFFFLFDFGLFFFTEEIGWRGYALPKLQTRFSPLVASSILGVLWGLWHTPWIFLAGSFQAQVPFHGFVLLAISQSIVMAWVYNHSRDSVLLAVLFHAAADVTFAVTGVLTGPVSLFWLVIGLQWLFTLVVIGLGGLKKVQIETGENI